jgi:hypothetical protein
VGYSTYSNHYHRSERLDLERAASLLPQRANSPRIIPSSPFAHLCLLPVVYCLCHPYYPSRAFAAAQKTPQYTHSVKDLKPGGDLKPPYPTLKA